MLCAIHAAMGSIGGTFDSDRVDHPVHTEETYQGIPRTWIATEPVISRVPGCWAFQCFGPASFLLNDAIFESIAPDLRLISLRSPRLRQSNLTAGGREDRSLDRDVTV